jgi:hypothetical protein
MRTRFAIAGRVRIALLAALLLPAGLAFSQRDPCIESKAPECRPIQQKRCRDAADNYLAYIKATPLSKPREIEESKLVIAKMEKKLADNRRAGVDDCVTWGEIGGIAAGQ